MGAKGAKGTVRVVLGWEGWNGDWADGVARGNDITVEVKDLRSMKRCK